MRLTRARFLQVFICIFVVAHFTVIPRAHCDEALPVVHIGSKSFTESYILAEILAQMLESTGQVKVERHLGMGGTGIVAQAIQSGQIDIYPEYTGTIVEAILKQPVSSDLRAIRHALGPLGLTISSELGFDDSYALAVRGDLAKSLKIKTVSDLKDHPELRVAFSHEFFKRSDGYEGLLKKYDLTFANVQAMEHALIYNAMASSVIDVADIYTTDAKIKKFALRVLKDDKNYFPKYSAVYLARSSVIQRAPVLQKVLRTLEDSITTDEMIRLNSLVELENRTFKEAAADFLKVSAPDNTNALISKLMRATRQHLKMVFFSLICAILVGLPMGVIAARYRKTGKILVLFSGVIQTVPSLALLSFLIPFFGIGERPALVALFLYGLLPIVTNVYVGLRNIDPKLIEVSRALNLSATQRLLGIELPLASPSIMAGVKLSAITNIGTATLAALIGAGGYGNAILTGIALNDASIILQGAIPAALMALAAYALFDFLELCLIPKGLRLKIKEY